MKSSSRGSLDVEHVVRVALDVLDQVGLDELSMRRLAEALGVQNPALYWHVKNKQELLDRMAQIVLADGFGQVEAGSAARSWKKKLERLARGLRAAMRSRRDGARLVSLANLNGAGSPMFARIDSVVTALVAEGFRAADALGAVLTVVHYTLGATLEEQADPRAGEPGLPAGIPMPAWAIDLPATGDSRVDARFELGVQLIVDGLAARKPRTRAAP